MPNYVAFLQRVEESRTKFEKWVTDGESRITEQMLLLERLWADGHDTTRAERFLETLEKSLNEWHQTRTDVTQIKQSYELLERD